MEVNMPTYYEILKLSPNATVASIKSAYNVQFDHWRRLVEHPDPATAKRAAQALGFLETARNTLLDPAKRAAYDASLKAQSGPVGGLADPQARSSTSTPPSPKPQSPSPTAPEDLPPDTWICPKCQAPNIRKMPYCPQCGAHVAHECPKCGALIEKISRFCSHCGADVQAVVIEQRYEELREQLRMEQRYLDFLSRRFNKAIFLPKTEEETRWNTELFDPEPQLSPKVMVLIGTILAVAVLCGAVGYVIGKAVDPMGYGMGGPAGGAEIGALIGAGTVGLLLGLVVAAYVIHKFYTKTEIKSEMARCKGRIAQLQHQIQNTSLTSSD
jgi:hypothetical protein